METIQAIFDYSKLENPMGERCKDALRLNFNRKLKLEFHGTKVTRDAGLLAYRELDEALGLTIMIGSEFYDNRKGKNTQHNITALLRQSIYNRLAGYDDTNDAERLALDPAMRQVVGGRAIERSASSTSAMSRFETESALPKKVKDWSLRTLKEKLIKIGAKVVRHSRYMIFQMAELAVPRTLFREILDRIRLLRLVAMISGSR